MKKIVYISFLIISLAFTSYIIPNPVMTFFINEFMFDSTGWEIELHPSYYGGEMSFDGWFFTSKTDTAFFKDGILPNDSSYIVITQDSLQSRLNIDPAGDTLTLYNPDSLAMEMFSFGNNNMYSPPAPRIGQSICLRIYSDGYSQQYFYYFDNTPTMGYENDTLNIKGYVDGYVKDEQDNPIEGVKIIYGYVEDPPNSSHSVYIETDSSGYFSYYDYSINKGLQFQKEGYTSADTFIQIWPDSTITINIKMNKIVGVSEINPPTINSFTLSQNFPNPFNSTTTFIYSLQEDEQVEINIYDEKGELVQKLFKGFQNKGEYRLRWNADNLASGIYFYELKTRNQKISKKCLLLK